MNRRVWALAALAAASCLVAAPAAMGFATFNDPTAGLPAPVTPLFEITATTVSGEWSDPGMDLYLGPLAAPYAGPLYEDVIFEFVATTYTPLASYTGQLDAGSFSFYEREAGDTKGAEILRVEFDQALFNRWGLGADNIFQDSGVTFTVFGNDLDLLEETFSFSFAHQVPNGPGFTASAAFTSSALVPEPVSLFLLCLGGIGMWLPRRRWA